MATTRIILLCIAAVVLFGIVHDQITARICIEYFTVAHPRVLETTDPTLIALYWGFAATWWVGVLLGVPLAIGCRAGSRPRIAPSRLIRPIGVLLLCMGCISTISGVVGFILASNGAISIGDWDLLIPVEKHARFLADTYAHLASYIVGFLGGIVVVVWAWRQRVRST